MLLDFGKPTINPPSMVENNNRAAGTQDNAKLTLFAPEVEDDVSFFRTALKCDRNFHGNSSF
jgi:hypothetical protein